MTGKRQADFQISQNNPDAPQEPKLFSSNARATAAQLAGRRIKPLKPRKPLGEGQSQNTSQGTNQTAGNSSKYIPPSAPSFSFGGSSVGTSNPFAGAALGASSSQTMNPANPFAASSISAQPPAPATNSNGIFSLGPSQPRTEPEAAPVAPGHGLFGTSTSTPQTNGFGTTGIGGPTNNTINSGFATSSSPAKRPSPFQTGSQTSFSPFGASTAEQPRNAFGFAPQTTTSSRPSQVASTGGFGTSSTGFGATTGSGLFGSPAPPAAQSSSVLTSGVLARANFADTAMDESTEPSATTNIGTPASNFSAQFSGTNSANFFGASSSGGGLFGSGPSQQSSMFSSASQQNLTPTTSTANAQTNVFGNMPPAQSHGQPLGFTPTFTPKPATAAPTTTSAVQNNMFANAFGRPASAPSNLDANTGTTVSSTPEPAPSNIFGFSQTPNQNKPMFTAPAPEQNQNKPVFTSPAPTQPSMFTSNIFAKPSVTETEKPTMASDAAESAPSTSMFAFAAQPSSSTPKPSATETEKPTMASDTAASAPPSTSMFGFTAQPSSSTPKPSLFIPQTPNKDSAIGGTASNNMFASASQKATPSAETLKSATNQPSNIFGAPVTAQPETTPKPAGSTGNIFAASQSAQSSPNTAAITSEDAQPSATFTPSQRDTVPSPPVATSEAQQQLMPQQQQTPARPTLTPGKPKQVPQTDEEKRKSLTTKLNKAFLARLKKMDLDQDWTKAMVAYVRVMSKITGDMKEKKLSRRSALNAAGRDPTASSKPLPSTKVRGMLGGPATGSKRGSSEDQEPEPSSKRGKQMTETPSEALEFSPSASTTSALFKNIVDSPAAESNGPGGVSFSTPQPAVTSAKNRQNARVNAPATEPAKAAPKSSLFQSQPASSPSFQPASAGPSSSLFSRAPGTAAGTASQPPSFSFLGAAKPSQEKKGKRTSDEYQENEPTSDEDEPQSKKTKGDATSEASAKTQSTSQSLFAFSGKQDSAAGTFTPSRTPTPSTSGRASVLDDPSLQAAKSGDNIFGHLSDVDSGADASKDDDSASDEEHDGDGTNNTSPDALVIPGDELRSQSPAVAEAWKELGESTQHAKTAPVQTLGTEAREAPSSGRSLFDRVSYDDAGKKADGTQPKSTWTPNPATSSPLSSVPDNAQTPSSLSMFGTPAKPAAATAAATGEKSSLFSHFGSSPPAAKTAEAMGPGDHTWKVNSPIKFGTMQGSSQQSLFGRSTGTAAPFGMAAGANADKGKGGAGDAASAAVQPATTTSASAFGSSSFGGMSGPPAFKGSVAESTSTTPPGSPAKGASTPAQNVKPLSFGFNQTPSTAFGAPPSSQSTFGFAQTPPSAFGAQATTPSALGSNQTPSSNVFPQQTSGPSTFGFLAPPTGTPSGLTSRATTPGVSTDGGLSDATKPDGDDEAPKDAQTDLSGLEQDKAGHDLLFEADRAKMKGLDPKTKEWVDEGSGAMLLLKNPDTNVVQMLMKTVPGGRVVLNSRVTVGLKFALSGTKTAIGSIPDPKQPRTLKRVSFMFRDPATARSFIDTHNSHA